MLSALMLVNSQNISRFGTCERQRGDAPLPLSFHITVVRPPEESLQTLIRKCVKDGDIADDAGVKVVGSTTVSRAHLTT